MDTRGVNHLSMRSQQAINIRRTDRSYCTMQNCNESVTCTNLLTIGLFNTCCPKRTKFTYQPVGLIQCLVCQFANFLFMQLLGHQQRHLHVLTHDEATTSADLSLGKTAMAYFLCKFILHIQGTRCWRDMLWKTVPDMRAGNWKRSFTVYGGQSAFEPRCLLAGRVRWWGTSLPLQTLVHCSQSTASPSTSVVDRGVEWCACTLTRNAPAKQQSLPLTESASVGAVGCRRGKPVIQIIRE